MIEMSVSTNSHKVASPAAVRAVALVTAAYILVAAVRAWVGGNTEFVFYIVVMIVLSISIYGVHRKVGLTKGLLWGISIWGLLHMAGGIVRVPESWPTNADTTPVLYNLWLIPKLFKYDQLTHVYGFGLTTWLCWQALSAGFENASGKRPAPTLGLMVLCAAAGMGFGAFNEIVEFIATITLESTNVGGYENTSWDLVANLAGSVIAAVWISIAGRKHDTDL